MSHLPNWVYDLVADLLEQEEVHPTLFHQAYTGEFARLDWCPAIALERMPDHVITAATVVSQYRAK